MSFNINHAVLSTVVYDLEVNLHELTERLNILELQYQEQLKINESLVNALGILIDK